MTPSKIPAFRHFTGDNSTAVSVTGPEADIRLTSYTGKPVDMPWGREIVDLDSIRFSEKTPILMQHDHSKRVGYSVLNRISDGSIVQDVKCVDTESASEYKRLAADGFPWQVSIGFGIGKAEMIEKGTSVRVNGSEWEGPIIVLRDSVHRESSLCSVGRDGDTGAVALSDEQGDSFVEVTMSEKTTEAVEVSPAVTIADYRDAFPGRLEYAVTQYEKGTGILEARAGLLPVLEADVVRLSAEVDRLSAELVKARAEGETGVVFAGIPDIVQADAKPPEHASIEEKCKWAWKHNDDSCHTEFPTYEAFHAYTKADVAGLVSILQHKPTK